MPTKMTHPSRAKAASAAPVTAAKAAAKRPAKRATAARPQAAKSAGKAPAKSAVKSAAKRVAQSTAKAPAKTSAKTPAKKAAARRVTPALAKERAVAKAKVLAPQLPARIGSTPATRFRGNPDIFGRLVEDHDHHRALLAMIGETKSAAPERKRLFKELVREVKAHAAAEEQALWSTVMRNPQTTDQARHAVGEHKELDKMMADLAARDMSASGWLRRFAGLREKYLHHIGEEEQEQFLAAQKHLTASDVRYMKQVFNRRKAAEKAVAKVTRKIRLK